MPSIAIVGMACRFPDARSPSDLWENVLAQRRAFRRIPSERLRLEDYYSSDPAHTDSTYLQTAALIEGYEFDRLRFRVSANTYRSVDLAHWLALDIAGQALVDAGFPEGESLPRETTGVLVGNSLTGEFSRASTLRLRWPFVRRVANQALSREGVSGRQRDGIIQKLEEAYLQPFAPTTEETLAGGLSNVIAGRICNHFNLGGGGYTLDGACASSLLAVISASTALESGDLDVALAGGVDLSLDPFELVGFSRVGAFSHDEMRIFDRRSGGFLPGEGCGFVVLMRHDDALRQGRNIYAVLRGWGISSDGAGGITRPEVDGQMLALRRAYRRAGFGIDTVPYFEGHGTGTPVGDLTELQALARARAECPPASPRVDGAPTADPEARRAYIGSVKGNIGHTKAAAGIAGLIKAVMVLQHQILPPTTGCEAPHPELTREPCAPAVLQEAAAWPTACPLRAGVSSMGFGGINTHVVLECPASPSRSAVGLHDELTSHSQDSEVILLSAADGTQMLRQIEGLRSVAPRISQAELTDLAAHLARMLVPGQARAAIVSGSPQELSDRLDIAVSSLQQGRTSRFDTTNGVFLTERAASANGSGNDPPRLNFLFPGQGGAPPRGAGALARRFPFVKPLFDDSNNGHGEHTFSGAVVQPLTVRAALAGMRVLAHLGIEAQCAAGHSLGELVALHWAGAFDQETLLRIACVRGRAMDQVGRPGAMAAISAGAHQVQELLDGSSVCLACLNSPHQTVVSGEQSAIADLVLRATARGLSASMLQTTHAFHSPLVSDAVPILDSQLAGETFGPLGRAVVSTVTGSVLGAQTDIRELLSRQVISPVHFRAAAEALMQDTGLLIEVGAGDVLTRLVSGMGDVPAVALDVGSPSIRGLLCAVGAAFALGVRVHTDRLFEGRFSRPFDPNRPLRFFANPCESVPVEPPRSSRSDGSAGSRRGITTRHPAARAAADEPVTRNTSDSPVTHEPSLDVLRKVLEERLELPASSINDSDHLLRDLHLNSISVGQIVAESARRLGLARPASPTEYAHATVGEVARTLDESRRTGPPPDHQDASRFPAGVDTWVRPFTVELRESPRPATEEPFLGQSAGRWEVIGPPDHPLLGKLRAAVADATGIGGIIVCLPPEPGERSIQLLLDGARRVLGEPADATRRNGGRDGSVGPGTFVLVQQDGGAAAFARSLFLEAPHVATCVVDLPLAHPDAVKWVLKEASGGSGYREAHYDVFGTRREPVIRQLDESGPLNEFPFSARDVLLVTGGGKGIAAECALALARDSNMHLGILGRSHPRTDRELSANLERLGAAGIRFHYVQADVADSQAVGQAINAVERELGPVTAVLHGAGNNSPRAVRDLDEAAFLHTLAPKVRGLENVLAALDSGRLRALVTFGSVIARTGFRGEADYAVANEWLARATEQFQLAHPNCRCLCLEWSIWSGVGMGERLGRVSALLQEGIAPITPDQGVAILRRLLCSAVPPCVVVSGRLGGPPTLHIDQPPLPRGRFLEDKKVYYPGVELVVDSRLSNGSDPYMDDHVLGLDRLFPGVMGLEAMAQAAAAVAGCRRPPIFEKVEFLRPVTVPEGRDTIVRVAALVRERNCVEVVLRTSQTDFQVDHFRSICRFGPGVDEAVDVKGAGYSPHVSRLTSELAAAAAWLPLVPSQDLYGEHLFQKGRFQRLEGYRELSAAQCVADIAGDGTFEWFAGTLPGERMLGDPGVRDAALHAVQACIPHRVVLPISVDKVTIYEPARGPCCVRAIERQRRRDTFVYDLDLIDPTGRLVESWHGLRFKATQPLKKHRAWSVPLLRPFLERDLFRVLRGRTLEVVIGHVDSREGAQTLALKEQLLGAHAQPSTSLQAVGTRTGISYRSDGKPEPAGGVSAMSFAYGEGLLLGVSGEGRLGCDLEAVVPRPAEEWKSLLGSSGVSLTRQICEIEGEEFNTAATRVWTVLESIKKAGLPPDTPLTIRPATPQRRISTGSSHPCVIAVGAARAATYLLKVDGCEHPLIATVLGDPRRTNRRQVAGANGRTAAPARKAYEYRHVVTFEDTNLLGNVYYVNYLSWQGRCRELFLREHAPEILAQLREDLRLVTVRVSCGFAVEVAAFDELLIRMTLHARKGNQLKLGFEYLRVSENGEAIPVANGTQVIACMRREGEHLVHTPIPDALLEALKPFASASLWKE